MKHQVFEAPLLDERRIEHLLKNSEGNNFSAEITNMFAVRSKELLLGLNYEGIRSNPAECKKKLHSLKGISLTMGANRMAEICVLLDKLISEGELVQASELVMGLEKTVSESLDAIRIKLKV